MLESERECGLDNFDPANLGVFDLGESVEPPPPQQFVIEEYVPEGLVTTLYAQPGSSKSFLALYLGFHVFLGRQVLGRAVKRGRVLYLDAELDRATFERRGWQIARGLGLDRSPKKSIYYYRLTAPLNDRAELARVRDIVDGCRPSLVIIDSFTAALRGRDSNSADDVTQRFDLLDGLGTVILIDHTAKATDIGGHVTAIGSQGKMMFARSAMFIAAGPKGGCVLRHTKHNLSAGADSIAFAWQITIDAATLEILDPSDPRLQGVEAAVSAKDRVRAAFVDGSYPDGTDAETIAKDLEMKTGTVRNQLTSLSRDGVIRRNPDGRWTLVDARSFIHAVTGS